MQVDYESARVAIYFPFMWSGFMSYFLLAAALVPFGPYIDPFLLQYIHWLTEIKISTVGTFNNLRNAVTDIDHLQAFIGESMHDLGLGGNHTDVAAMCVSNTTLGGEAGGPQPEMPCVFPFDYCDQGSGDCVTYTACTAHDAMTPGQPWCATRSTADGGWEGHHWGYCDCGTQQAAGMIGKEMLTSARVDNLMSYWRYNHRISITLDGQMIGPLVVAVWLDFVFKNLIPFCEYHRRNFEALRRGTRIGRCARILLPITCCFGGSKDQQTVFGDRKLSEAVGEDESDLKLSHDEHLAQIKEAREKFVDRLQKRLEDMGEINVMALPAQDEEGAIQASPRSAAGRKKVLVVSSLVTKRQRSAEEKKRRRIEALQCCKASKSDELPDKEWARCSSCSCCTVCRCQCCNDAERELNIETHAANYLLLESDMWQFDSFFEYAELVGQFTCKCTSNPPVACDLPLSFLTDCL